MTSRKEKGLEAVDFKTRRNEAAVNDKSKVELQVDFAITEALLSSHAGRLALRAWRKTDWGRAAIEAHKVTSILALLDDDKKQATAEFRWCEIEQQLLKSFVRTEVNQVMAMLSDYVRTGTYR
jgi:hypothetical protein